MTSTTRDQNRYCSWVIIILVSLRIIWYDDNMTKYARTASMAKYHIYCQNNVTISIYSIY